MCTKKKTDLRFFFLLVHSVSQLQPSANVLTCFFPSLINTICLELFSYVISCITVHGVPDLFLTPQKVNLR